MLGLAITILVLLQPWTVAAGSPPAGGRSRVSAWEDQGGLAAPVPMGGPPWPPAGVGAPTHYADWAMLSGDLEAGPPAPFILPREVEGGGLRFLAVERGGRALVYMREGGHLRMGSCAILSYAAEISRATLARDADGGELLLVGTTSSEVRSFWAGNLTPRALVHPQAHLLGTGDWDGDGADDAWLLTTSGFLLVVNATTGDLMASSGSRLADTPSSPACADIDTDGKDELVMLVDGEEILVAGGEALDPWALYTDPLGTGSLLPELRILPGNGTAAPAIACPKGQGGLLLVEPATCATVWMDRDIGLVVDVVSVPSPSGGNASLAYLLANGTLARSDGRGNRTWHRSGHSSDVGCCLAILDEPAGASVLAVVTELSGLRLVDPTDLSTVARGDDAPAGWPGPMVLAPELRSLGIPADAVVIGENDTYGSHTICLLDAVNRTLNDTRIYVSQSGTMMVWWSYDGWTPRLLIAEQASSGRTNFECYRVVQGRLQDDYYWFISQRLDWLVRLDRPGQSPLLVGGGPSDVWSIDPATRVAVQLRATRLLTPAIGDVDGDGAKELLCADTSDVVHCIDPISFDDEWTYNSTRQVDCMAVADLDGDGSQEVAVSRHRAPLLVLNATSRNETSYSPAPISNATSLVAADLDRDGTVELALAREWDDDVVVMGRSPSGGLVEEWRCGVRSDDTPALQGALAVGDGTWLPVLGAHPFLALGFTDRSRLGDLRVANLTTAATSIIEGDRVAVCATVRLDGGFPTDALVDLYEGDPYAQTWRRPVSSAVVRVEPGGEARADLTWAAAYGDTTLFAAVNGVSRHLVAETDYDDNSARLEVRVSRQYAEVAWTLGFGASTGTLGRTAAADADGDGADELVMLDDGGHLLVVDLADANASAFARPSWRSDRLGTEPMSMALDDLDGDGAPEAVVATNDSRVLVLDLRERRVVSSSSVATWGILDVGVVHDRLTRTTWIALHDMLSYIRMVKLEDLGKDPAPTHWYPSSPMGSAMEVADFDGDGFEDVVVLGTGPDIAFHPGGRWDQVRLIRWPGYRLLATAHWDLDGDGAAEILAAGEQDLLVLDLVDNGTWRTDPLVGSVALEEPPLGLACGDWDWDGRPEVIVAGRSVRMFGPNASSPDPWEGPVEELAVGLPAGANGAAGGAFPDRPGLRVAIPLDDGRVALLDGLSGGTEVLYGGLGARTLSLAAGDVDADGIPEVVAGTALSGLQAIAGISLQSSFESDTGPAWALATGDWDGDGDLEVATQDLEGSIVAIGPGGEVERTLAKGLPGTVRALVALDAGGDGVPDLAWAEDDWTVRVLNSSSGAVEGVKWASAAPVQLAVTRTRGPGDLLVLPQDTSVALLDPVSLRTVGRVPLFKPVAVVATFPVTEGRAAMAVAATDGGDVVQMDLSSDADVRWRALGAPVTALLARDLDGDSRVEVVVALSDGSLRVLQGDTLEDLPRPLWPTASPVACMAADDVDLDGAIEVVLGASSEIVALRVGVGSPSPDILALVAEAPAGPLSAGEGFRLVLRVLNRGLVATGPFVVTLAKDGAEVSRWDMDLAPFASEDLDVHLTAPDWDGAVNLTLRGDALGNVTEFDEANNLLDVVVVTGPRPAPVLRLSVLAVQPREVLEGEAVVLTLEASNIGDATFIGDVLVSGASGGQGGTPLALGPPFPITVGPGEALVLELRVSNLTLAMDTIVVSLREGAGGFVPSARASITVTGRADLELLSLELNGTGPIFAGLPTELVARVRNAGSARGAGHLVVSLVTGSAREALAVASVDLGPGEAVNVSIPVVLDDEGLLELEAVILPGFVELDTADDSGRLQVRVEPRPSTLVRIIDMQATRARGPKVHITLVVSVGGVLPGGRLVVRVFAIDRPVVVNLTDGRLVLPPGGFPMVCNWTVPAEPRTEPVLDSVVDLGLDVDLGDIDPLGPLGLLAIADFELDSSTVQVGHAFSDLPPAQRAEGDGDGRSAMLPSIALLVTLAAMVAIALAVRRARRSSRRGGPPPRSGARDGSAATDVRADRDLPVSGRGRRPRAAVAWAPGPRPPPADGLGLVGPAPHSRPRRRPAARAARAPMDATASRTPNPGPSSLGLGLTTST